MFAYVYARCTVAALEKGFLNAKNQEQCNTYSKGKRKDNQCKWRKLVFKQKWCQKGCEDYEEEEEENRETDEFYENRK